MTRRRTPSTQVSFDPKRVYDDRTPGPSKDAPRGVCRLCQKPIVGEILTIGGEHWHPACEARSRKFKYGRREPA